MSSIKLLRFEFEAPFFPFDEPLLSDPDLFGYFIRIDTEIGDYVINKAPRIGTFGTYPLMPISLRKQIIHNLSYRRFEYNDLNPVPSFNHFNDGFQDITNYSAKGPMYLFINQHGDLENKSDEYQLNNEYDVMDEGGNTHSFRDNTFEFMKNIEIDENDFSKAINSVDYCYISKSQYQLICHNAAKIVLSGGLIDIGKTINHNNTTPNTRMDQGYFSLKLENILNSDDGNNTSTDSPNLIPIVVTADPCPPLWKVGEGIPFLSEMIDQLTEFVNMIFVNSGNSKI